MRTAWDFIIDNKTHLGVVDIVRYCRENDLPLPEYVTDKFNDLPRYSFSLQITDNYVNFDAPFGEVCYWILTETKGKWMAIPQRAWFEEEGDMVAFKLRFG